MQKFIEPSPSYNRHRNGLGVFETPSYAEGVIASSPGLQCEASYPGYSSVKKMPYPIGVIADRKRICNNAFSVESQRDLNPG